MKTMRNVAAKKYTPKGSTVKSEGIRVARLIASGLISEARAAVAMYRWPARTVSEARAIIGACRFINEKFGANLNRVEFMYPERA